MKLYSSNLSPYATRVRMQLYYKGINAEQVAIEAPPVPLRTPEFFARYPLGKIPLLELDDGEVLPESWSIMEYLETQFPDKPLAPASAIEKARMSVRARYTDLHLAPALFPLFKPLIGVPGVDIKAAYQELKGAVTKGERLWQIQPQLGERALDLADIAMAPVWLFAEMTLTALNQPNDLLAELPGLRHWWQQIQAIDAIATGLDENRQAFAALTAKV